MTITKCLTAYMMTTAFVLISADPVNASKMKEDNEHVRVWNKFADDVLSLHKKLAKEKTLVKETRGGGYFGNPDFYTEEVYTDKRTAKEVSRIQWERAHPDTMHAIQVNIYDNKGRIIRDYAAAYLPEFRNAPTQTLLSLYVYNGDLQAYRTFDASGARIGERCIGQLKGKKVDFILDEDEIYADRKTSRPGCTRRCRQPGR